MGKDKHEDHPLAKRTGGSFNCPHCGKTPWLSDIQRGQCPDTGGLLDPFDLEVAGDVHDPEELKGVEP